MSVRTMEDYRSLPRWAQWAISVLRRRIIDRGTPSTSRATPGVPGSPSPRPATAKSQVNDPATITDGRENHRVRRVGLPVNTSPARAPNQ